MHPFSCDYNKYSLQYILSLAENKRKKAPVEETSQTDSDSDNFELMKQSDSENEQAELLLGDSDMET